MLDSVRNTRSVINENVYNFSATPKLFFKKI